MLKRTLFFISTFLLINWSYGQQKYHKAKILLNGHSIEQLASLGLPVDHGEHKKDHFIISDFSENDLLVAEENDFLVEILIPDVQKFYVNQNLVNTPKNVTCASSSNGGSFNPAIPSNFYTNPSYGGFLKYQDMLDQLDLMASTYPNLITVKSPISSFTTHQNRPIYYVKISDNPSFTDDLSEPNVLYTAIHHAREPLSMAQTVFYMWYLLENYATSAEIQFLVDNTEMFFVPCINPDGYLRNESTNPNGGGMHRKNLAPVGSSNPGVDLNRNYSYGWNTTGVSSNTNNDTYPGTSAFSEPETQAMKWLVETYGFVSAFNAHTYGNTLLHPIGTTNAEYADHHDYFADLTTHMCKHNGYFPQKSSGLYPASGDSDDYEYKVDIGVGMKDTIFAMTPEIGTDFWPPSSEVLPTCQDMIFPNLVLSHMAHKYLVVDDNDPSTVATLNGDFSHNVQRLGREDGPITVSITPILNIQSVGPGVVYDIAIRETATGNISYSLNPSIAFGDEIKYILNTEYGSWTHQDTIIKSYGALTLQYFDDASNTTNWTGNWNTTTSEFYSPNSSFADSPGGNYANNSTKTYEFNQNIDLTNATAASASFYAKWTIEADYDYCQFQVSTDGGANWIGQCGNYTVEGSSTPWNGSVQPNGEPVYEGSSNWIFEEINLSDYLGQLIRVRFILEADGGVTEDGFYFDDFSISYNDDNPIAPTANFSISNVNVCVGSTVYFNDFSTGSPDTWAWDFGDGGTSSDQSPSYVFSTPGNYTITLVASNSIGTDTYALEIVVGSESTNSQSVTICEGDSFTVGTSVYNATGIFTDVLVNAAGCDSIVTTNLTVEQCAGIEEDYFDPIVVYPNPSAGFLSINGLPSGTTFEIYNESGQLILRDITVSNDYLINLENQSSGKYFLQTTIQNRLINLEILIIK